MTAAHHPTYTAYFTTMPTPSESTALSVTLDEAIRSASQKQLSELLLSICKKYPEAHAETSAHLLAPLPTLSGLKRKAFEICENCDEEYHVEKNEDGDCVFHDGRFQNKSLQRFPHRLLMPRLGEKEVDDEDDFWADHDPDVHGEPRG